MSEQEFNLGKWLSAAMEDDSVCKEMKSDIADWFNYVERKDAQIEALRGFAMFIFLEGFYGAELEVRGLTDENGNPTKLLTGEE